jgi:uncharacterized protein YfaT (DUF1175 family)
VIEAPNPHGKVFTFTPYICKVFDNHHMLWMGIWIHHHAVTATLVSPDFGSPAEILGRYLHAVVESLNTHGMLSTSTLYIYKVFDNHHMLWMGIWVHHHAATTTLVQPRFGKTAVFPVGEKLIAP